jgi:hypothetical protein
LSSLWIAIKLALASLDLFGPELASEFGWLALASLDLFGPELASEFGRLALDLFESRIRKRIRVGQGRLAMTDYAPPH